MQDNTLAAFCNLTFFQNGSSQTFILKKTSFVKLLPGTIKAMNHLRRIFVTLADTKCIVTVKNYDYGTLDN
jgi:hypothetical protein